MKIDFKKQIDTYSAPRTAFSIVEVPTMQFLMVDGCGDPNTSQAYSDALATIYPVAYRLKFFSKNELDQDYSVMPLEALWWSGDMQSFTVARNKSLWEWTLLNMVPAWITQQQFSAAVKSVATKGGAPLLDVLRLEQFDEGLSVQTLHIGSFDDEASVLQAIHDDFIPTQGLRMTGKHHEIYLSDPRRTVAEKLRTILRQPVARVDQ